MVAHSLDGHPTFEVCWLKGAHGNCVLCKALPRWPHLLVGRLLLVRAVPSPLGRLCSTLAIVWVGTAGRLCSFMSATLSEIVAMSLRREMLVVTTPWIGFVGDDGDACTSFGVDDDQRNCLMTWSNYCLPSKKKDQLVWTCGSTYMVAMVMSPCVHWFIDPTKNLLKMENYVDMWSKHFKM